MHLTKTQANVAVRRNHCCQRARVLCIFCLQHAQAFARLQILMQLLFFVLQLCRAKGSCQWSGLRALQGLQIPNAAFRSMSGGTAARRASKPMMLIHSAGARAADRGYCGQQPGPRALQGLQISGEDFRPMPDSTATRGRSNPEEEECRVKQLQAA